MSILTQPDIASAAEQLVTLHSCIERRKVQAAVTGSNTKRSGAASPVVWAVHLNALGQRMTPPDQLRCRLGTAFPQRPGRECRAARSTRHGHTHHAVAGLVAAVVPTVAVPARGTPGAVCRCPARRHHCHGRAGRSAAGRLGQRAAGRQCVVAADETDYWQQIRSALIRLADHLAAHLPTIDCQRRRHLDYTALLPETAWSGICRRSGRAHLPRVAYLRERLSGLPAFAHPLPGILRQRPPRHLPCFRPGSLRNSQAALDDYALTFLAEQGISDEPVL